MTQNQIWSMHSTDDSLWGDDDVVPPLDEDTPQPPETWLMLEFCDRGSLLVSYCSSITSFLVQLFDELLHLCLPYVGYSQKTETERVLEFCMSGCLLVSSPSLCLLWLLPCSIN